MKATAFRYLQIIYATLAKARFSILDYALVASVGYHASRLEPEYGSAVAVIAGTLILAAGLFALLAAQKILSDLLGVYFSSIVAYRQKDPS